MQHNIDWWRPQTGFQYTARTASGEAPGFEGTAFEGTGKWTYRLLVSLVVILILAPQSFIPALEPLRLAMLFSGLCVASYIISRQSQGLPLWQDRKATAAVAVLLAWAVMTVPMSYWPGGSVAYLFDYYIKTLVVFYLLVFILDSVDRLWHLSWALVLTASVLAVSTISNYQAGAAYGVAGSQVALRFIGYGGPLTENPNDMALMLNLILPLAISMMLASRKFLARVLTSAISLLVVTAIVLTFSRAGFITLAVTLLIYMWLVRNRRERILAPVAIVLALASIPFLPGGYVERMSTITEVEADPTGSAQARVRDMTAATEYVASNPLIGAGLGMNAIALNEVRGVTWTEIHNVYLQHAVELGLPGLLLFLVVLGVVFQATNIRRYQHTAAFHDYRFFYLAQGLRVSLIAFMVEAFFHPVAFSVYFYLIAGMAVSLHTIAMQAPATREPGAAPTRNLSVKTA